MTPSPNDLALAIEGISVIPEESRSYTESERTLALAVFAESNCYREASRITGIPHNTIWTWINSDEESAAVVDQLRTALRVHTAWGYAEIVQIAQAQLLERLKHGDPHVLKNGSIVYHPVKARDLMMIAAVSQDKHAMVTGALEGSRQVDKQLSTLADKLLKEVRKRAPSPHAPIDATPHMG